MQYSHAANFWTTIISPHRGVFDWKLSELWRCRDLISLLVRRDFVAVYKQTILGPAWHIIQPLLTTLTFTIIFGKIAALPTNDSPPFLFYLTGYVWQNVLGRALPQLAQCAASPSPNRRFNISSGSRSPSVAVKKSGACNPPTIANRDLRPRLNCLTTT
jgi:hypothetical protein